MTKFDFLYFDAGGGHRAAATALHAQAQREQRPWDVRLVNLQEVLNPLDVFRKVTGIRLENIYNKMLAKGWTLGAAQSLRFMQSVLRRYHDPSVELLARHWTAVPTDAVVSLVPNLNRAAFEGLRKATSEKGGPHVPYISILTDFADYPPHFWIEQQDQYFICGTERAVEQARALGHPPERIYRASGMILRPSFYEPVNVDRAAERRRLGLDPDRPVGLVLFGGQGSKAMLDIARALPETQLIMLCGRNQTLAERLRALAGTAPRHIEGFTSEIPYFMHLADFFIGKPGPGSISEAVAMGLPVIVEHNAWTLPQERYNTTWVTEKGVGLVLPDFSGIRGAVEMLLGDLDRYRSAVGRIENRAVFEIPRILAEIIEKTGAAR